MKYHTFTMEAPFILEVVPKKDYADIPNFRLNVFIDELNYQIKDKLKIDPEAGNVLIIVTGRPLIINKIIGSSLTVNSNNDHTASISTTYTRKHKDDTKADYIFTSIRSLRCTNHLNIVVADFGKNKFAEDTKDLLPDVYYTQKATLEEINTINDIEKEAADYDELVQKLKEKFGERVNTKNDTIIVFGEDETSTF